MKWTNAIQYTEEKKKKLKNAQNNKNKSYSNGNFNKQFLTKIQWYLLIIMMKCSKIYDQRSKS